MWAFVNKIAFVFCEHTNQAYIKKHNFLIKTNRLCFKIKKHKITQKSTSLPRSQKESTAVLGGYKHKLILLDAKSRLEDQSTKPTSSLPAPASSSVARVCRRSPGPAPARSASAPLGAPRRAAQCRGSAASPRARGCRTSWLVAGAQL